MLRVFFLLLSLTMTGKLFSSDFSFPSMQDLLRIYGHSSERELNFSDFKEAQLSMARFPRVIELTASFEKNPERIDSKEELLIAYLLIQEPRFYRNFPEFSTITNIYAHPDDVIYHIVYLLQVIKRKNPEQSKTLELHQYHFLQDYHLSVTHATLYWYQKSIFYLLHAISSYPSLKKKDLDILKKYTLGKINKDSLLFYLAHLILNPKVSEKRKSEFSDLTRRYFEELKEYVDKMNDAKEFFVAKEDPDSVYPEKLVGIPEEDENILRFFWDGTGPFKPLIETEKEIAVLY